jgi:hypothetical protein
MSVLLLGLNSLFTLTLQCASFFLASAWQQADSADESMDGDWTQQQEEQLAQHGARIDAADAEP